MQETQETGGSIPGLGKSSGEGHGNPLHILAWRIPWTEEPGGLQSMGSQRVRGDWATEHTHTQPLLENTKAFQYQLEPKNNPGKLEIPVLDEETKPKGDFGLASHKKDLEKIYITERKSRKITNQTEGSQGNVRLQFQFCCHEPNDILICFLFFYNCRLSLIKFKGVSLNLNWPFIYQ